MTEGFPRALECDNVSEVLTLVYVFNQRDSRFIKDFYMVICHRQWNERTILKQFPFFQFSSNKIESHTEIYDD